MSTAAPEKTMEVAPPDRRLYLFVLGLTLVRAPLIFVFFGAAVFTPYPNSKTCFLIAFAAMVLSAVTDLFDGYLARRFRVTSRLGSYADPLTDKIFYLTTFPTLVYFATREGQYAHAALLLLLTIVFLLRDQWVSFLRSLGALHNLNAKANWSGKARTAVAFPMVCIAFYHLQAPKQWPLKLSSPLLYSLEVLSLIINVVSIVVYTMHFWPALSAELEAYKATRGE